MPLKDMLIFTSVSGGKAWLNKIKRNCLTGSVFTDSIATSLPVLASVTFVLVTVRFTECKTMVLVSLLTSAVKTTSPWRVKSSRQG